MYISYFWPFIRLFTAQYLIHQGVVAIIGPAMSSDVTFTQPYFAGFNVPQFAPVATNPTFSFTPANFPYLLRMSPSDTVQCQALAGIIEYYNWTQFALLVSKDDYGIFSIKSGAPGKKQIVCLNLADHVTYLFSLYIEPS